MSRLERRRGFVIDHRAMGRLLKDKTVTGRIALLKAQEIADLAGNIAGSYSDTGGLASSYEARLEPGFITSTFRAGTKQGPRRFDPHAYATVYSNDPAAAPNEFGGRKGRGPKQPRRILFRAGLVYHVPKAAE